GRECEWCCSASTPGLRGSTWQSRRGRQAARSGRSMHRNQARTRLSLGPPQSDHGDAGNTTDSKHDARDLVAIGETELAENKLKNAENADGRSGALGHRCRSKSAPSRIRHTDIARVVRASSVICNGLVPEVPSTMTYDAAVKTPAMTA